MLGTTWAFWLIGLAACENQPESRALVLDGPVRLSVDTLGPVASPKVSDSESGDPVKVKWTSDTPEVAEVDGDTVRAVGPGETTLTAEWEGQAVAWTLVVEPIVRLRLIDPPGSVGIGEEAPIVAEAWIGAEQLSEIDIQWSSSAPDIAAVDATGVVRGKSTGITYITASGPRGEAMLELEVTAE